MDKRTAARHGHGLPATAMTSGQPLLAVGKLLPQGRGLARALLARASSVELDWELRQKSRFSVPDSAGRALGIFLPRGTQLRGGDVLLAVDGSLVRVHAARQPVLRISCCAQHAAPLDLLRAAYHLGNRHVAVELQSDHLKIEPDHVLAELLRAMGLIVAPLELPFEPEGGAYASGQRAGHPHHHHGPGHDHDHDHGH